MKKILIFLFCCLTLISCVSTDIEYYDGFTADSNKVFIQLDQNSTTVTSGSSGYVTSYGWAYLSSSSETAKFGTIRNRELIKTALEERGYIVVGSIEDADIVMVGENSTDSDYSTVTLGFYNKKTNRLMFICEGRYGLGFDIQEDVDRATLKALESVPIII